MPFSTYSLLPSLQVLIEDIEAYFPNEERDQMQLLIVSEMTQQLERVTGAVVVVCTTSMPEMLSNLVSSCFEHQVAFEPPTIQERCLIFQAHAEHLKQQVSTLEVIHIG